MADFVRVPETDWQNILDATRAKTGGTEKMVSGVVADAIAGIVAGGGGASGIYMAKITPASEVSSFDITHNLGTTDILCALCWAETLGDTVLTANRITMKTWLKTDIPVRLTSSSTHPNIDIYNNYSASDSWISPPNQATSEVYLSSAKDENTFFIYCGGSASAKFAAGVTYTVIIMAASAFAEV
jgi:hypothetical protein